MINPYSPEHQEKIKQEIGTLEESIQEIYKKREPRSLLGSEGIIMRTLGPRFNKEGNNYVATYFDSRRKERVQTEYAEFIEACDIYDEDNNPYNAVDMLMEAGDILFQKAIIEKYHKRSQGYNQATNQFEKAITKVKQRLQKRKFSLKTAQKICEVKYGVRAWLAKQNLQSKNHELEEMVCLNVFNNQT